MLTISVKNFGPIAEGSVDLKPLTIFVGPSNTGKSYMATAVYAVMRASNQDFDVRWSLESRRANLRRQTAQSFEGEISEEVLSSLERWVRRHFKNSSNISQTPLSSLPDEVFHWLDESIVQQVGYLREDICNLLSDIHGGSESFLKLSSDPSNFQLLIRQDDPKLRMEINKPATLCPNAEIDISNSRLPDLRFILPVVWQGIDPNEWRWVEIANYLVSVATKSVLSKFPSHSYYLPAARSGIVQGHKLFSAQMVRQSSLIGVRGLSVPPMPAISAEFLSHLIRLDRHMLSLGSKEALTLATNFIETDVLRGKIEIDESEGLPYPQFVYLPMGAEQENVKFTLDRTSSMVSELAPVILFLKCLLDKGDLLILEEPESHLHPAAQRQLARGIVRLVNAGVKVLITTHSDIIISQVNNLLALNQASAELIAEGGFEPEDFLSEEQVGAYLFRHSKRLDGSEVVSLAIDPDTGIDEDEFADVFEAIYNESIALQRDRS